MSKASDIDIDAVAEVELHDAHLEEANLRQEVAQREDQRRSNIDEDWWPDKPTEEDLHALRRVSGKINWSMWTIAFTELCERFSYYGSSVLYTNFVNHPLPPGSSTGSAPSANGLPGALGMGTRAAQAIALFNQSFASFMPLIGAWIADAHMGRFWTLHLAIGISTIAHVVLVAASSPHVIVKKDSAFATFIIGLVTLCVGTGFFKANVSPLLAEQNEDTRMRVKTLPSGERVIIDPSVTNARIFLYFYFAINLGSLTGQIGMVYVEKYVGFWAAFLIPTGMFLIAPFMLWSQKKYYRLTPPTGSLLEKFLKMFWHVRKQSRGLGMNWDLARPSRIVPALRPKWMTYDEAWVDEVRRGLMACKVFLFLPIFFLSQNQMTANLTIQASTMQRHGFPNDMIQNLNPVSIVVMIPVMDHLVYPFLRRIGVAFTPIKRMTTGFMFASLAMTASAVMQHYIYKMSPCGDHANGTIVVDGKQEACGPAPINVWAQCLPYVLIGLSEIFTNVTSYEYAYSKAPENMKSLVMSIILLMSAISAAMSEAFTPLAADPFLVWNYVSIAIIAFLGGVAFWSSFRHLDTDEDKWNMLKKSKFVGKNEPGLNKGVKTEA